MTSEGVFFSDSADNFFYSSFQLEVEGDIELTLLKRSIQISLDKCFLWSLKEPWGLSAAGLFILSIFINS
jgi:hypothetical protein